MDSLKRTPSRPPGRRALLLVTLFAVALVILPFLFWYDTWFGRRLTDGQIEKYLTDSKRPRRAQHALVQIGERLGEGDESVRRWYPKIIELASGNSEELRQTTAWIMGQDNRYEPFHQALLSLFRDPSALVRRNAALSLAAFGDSAGRSELCAMLRPAMIAAPVAGPVKYRLKVEDYVNPGTLVAWVGEVEVRAALPGEVRALIQPEGGEVSLGQPLVEVSPDEKHAWEALRALYMVGGGDDVEDVQRYARGVPGVSVKLRQQAALTLRQIQSRRR
jgi:biotin carboxyl carrier protein